MKRKVSIVIISAIIFILGYSVGAKELPFDDSVKGWYQENFLSIDNTKFEIIDPFLYETSLTEIVSINSKEEIINKRNELINYIWKDTGFPYDKMPNEIIENITDSRYSEIMNNVERLDKISIASDFGIESYVYFFYVSSSRDLIIYHEGHNGDFINGYDLIKYFTEQGYSVLAFSMPLSGMNNQPVVELPRIGKIHLTKHDDFHFLDSPEFSSFQFFVEPIAAALNYIDSKYEFDNVYATGISGGAWTITVYSALDDRISKSFPVAGSTPLFIRAVHPDMKQPHYELTNSEFYKTTNYLELYILASYGENREQLQIRNKYDACCHYGIDYQVYEQFVKDRLAEIGPGKFGVFLDDTHRKHMISKTTMEIILASLN